MSPSRRLAFCITELAPGGAERCLTELVTRLDRRKFEPIVYSLAPAPAPHEPSLRQVLEAAGVPLRFLGAHRAWRAPAVVRRLASSLRQDQPSLLQTFLFHANILGRIAGRRAHVPRIVSGIRVAERRHGWYLWLDRWTQRMVDRHVCVSQSVADFSSRVAGLPADRLTVIPNGIDVERFVRASPADLRAYGVGAGRKALIFVGRLDAQKRARWLIDMAPQWLDLLPNYDLLLVGDGPERGDLEMTCRQQGIANRVHLAGWSNEVPSILKASHVLLLPSAWEGMPNVVLEAMAAGLPVVCTEVEGVRELLGPQFDQQTAPLGNAQLFSDKLVAIAGSPELAAKLGAGNQERARLEFSLDAMVQSYSELYESLLSRLAQMPKKTF